MNLGCIQHFARLSLRNLVFASILIFTSPSYGHNKVVVIPLGADAAKPLQNVVTVSRQNGDFNSIELALRSITDASNGNPYVVFVGPGTYEVDNRLVVPSYVSLVGAGRDRTFIRGGRSTDDAATGSVISLSANSALSDLTVNHTDSGEGGGTLASAISIIGDFVTVDNVTALSSSGTFRSYVIFIRNDAPNTIFANVRILNSVMAVTRGSAIINGSCIGLVSDSVAPILENVELLILCSLTDIAGGVSISGGSSTILSRISNSEITVRGEGQAVGIAVNNGGLELRNSEVVSRNAANSGFAIGIRNLNNSSFVRARGSSIDAVNALLASTGSGSSETTIFHSVLNGNAVGDPLCRYTVDNAGSFLNSNCQ